MYDDSKKVYLIFRVYKHSETKEEGEVRYFGWSTFKKVVKAFFEQRDKDKYSIVESTVEESCEIYDRSTGAYYLDDEFMLNFIKLPSSKSDAEYTFITTQYELRESEIKIQRMMKDQCSLESIPGIKDSGMGVLECFINLKPKYANILYYLGYRPKDLDALFPTEEDEEESIENQINDAYNGNDEHPSEEYKYIIKPLGLSTLEDISNKILYSIEAFIKVLREDL